MKLKFKKVSIFMLLAVLLTLICFPAVGAAAAAPKLNSTKVYLYLGKKGSNTYDFNVANKGKGWSYSWSSSNKAIAKVNSTNGLATATGIGSAKITVVIKSSAGKVLHKLTATVIVKDNIKSLKIINKPEGDQLTVGAENTFQVSFTTVSGSKAKTTSILKWTVNKSGASITNKGLFTATQPGKYKITVNAFQSEDKYKLWLTDEKKNAANRLATASYTVTVEEASDGKVAPAYTYELSDGIAFISNLAELKGALLDEKVAEMELIQPIEISEDITVTKNLLVIEQEVINTGILTIQAQVTLGGVNFINRGSVIILETASLGVYMSNVDNQADITVEADGQLIMDRGGQFNNNGSLINKGKITVTSDGGSFNNHPEGTVENNGIMDCTGYYQNNGSYQGTGTEPETRIGE